jgi:TRAP-type C4-dicarboxylate transport system substrate-binding protein
MELSRRLLIRAMPALACAGGFSLAGRAWGQEFAMKLTASASNDIDTEWLGLLKQGVETASAGRIRADVYPGGQLGSTETLIEGVTLGTIEVTMNASGSYEGLEPRLAILAVPGLLGGMEQGAKVLADPDVRRRLGLIARDKGVEVITALPAAPAGIVSRRPIASLADLKGMKIRVPGSALLIAQLTALGASPVSMSLGEVLPALQNGTIDGVFAATTIFSALKYYDVAKSMTLLPATLVVTVGLVNSDFMASLGPLETLVRDEVRKADAAATAWGETDVTNAHDAWQSNGGQTLALPAADAARYLDTVVPTALSHLSAAARDDYDVLKAAAARYG